MKFNKWTLGLAAIGVVSLASVARADEKVNLVQTALTGTTIGGYVDTSMQWNFGTGNLNNPPYSFGGAGKADGFSLNVVQLTINKPLDESEWAAGYRADLWFGPDAGLLGTDTYFGNAGNFGIRQAYVNLRTPVGNGIEWKIGVFDTVIGYESLDDGNNPNFTRSYGFSIEPTTHTGVLGSYRVNDMLTLSAGVANTVGPVINDRAFLAGNKAESYKTYMGSIAFTAPSSCGWAAGSTLYAGVVNGFNSGSKSIDDGLGNLVTIGNGNQTSWYVGSTLATPVAGLKVGASFDYLDVHEWADGAPGNGSAWAAALYGSFQANEKLSLNLRGEYLDDKAFIFARTTDGTPLNSGSALAYSNGEEFKVWALTATVQYDLWKNVISRLEFRWDHSDTGDSFGNNPSVDTTTRKNACMLAANIIYKF